MEVEYQSENKHLISSYILSTIIAFVLMVGVICSLEKLISSNNLFITLIVIAFVVVVMQSVLIKNKHYFRIVIGQMVSIVALIALTMQVFLSGYVVTINRFINVYNSLFDDYLQKYNVVIDNNSVFLIALIIMLSLWVVHLINKNSLVLLSILVIAVFGFSCMFSLANSIYPPLLLIFVYFFTWFHMINPNMGIKGQIITQIPMILLIVICLISSSNYSALKSVDRIKDNMTEGINHVRYGKDNLPEGDLTKYSDLLNGNEDTLQLTYSSNPFATYLKGFVGSNYNGTNWTKLSKKVYYQDYSGIIDWLKNKKNFVSQYQYTQFNKLNNTKSDDYSLTIKNISASRKYIYLPYDSSGNNSESDYYFDQTTISNKTFGSKNYTTKGSHSSEAYELLSAPAWLTTTGNDYIDGEKVYRYFVYQNFVTIDDDTKDYINKFFYQDDLDNESLYTITTRIRTILTLTTEYIENPQKYEGNEDFIKFFLEDYKKGNASSFATVATLAYRAKGIPARYVEGYYYNPDNDNKTVTLTSKNSHCWVEVYIDGIGWLPIEFTPGFYTSTLPVNQVVGMPEQKPVAVDPNKDTVDQFIQYNQVSSKEDEVTPVEKSIAYISIILLSGFGIYLLLELQRMMRRKSRIYRISCSDEQEKTRYQYDNFIRSIKILKIDSSLYNKPYLLIKEIDKLVDIDDVTLAKGIGYMQESIFGKSSLLPYQIHTVNSSINELNINIYDSLKWYQRLLWRYIYCNDVNNKEL